MMIIKRTNRLLAPLLIAGGLSSCSQSAPEEEWIQLFNGETLDGWTPKFAGHALGQNYRNTFTVQDGFLTIDYSEYPDTFNREFGHLFYKAPYSHYVLRTTYRFLDKKFNLPEDMQWAWRNNGIMIHSQPPASMGIDQEFPASIEVQLLGSTGTTERSNANLCLPQSHVIMDDELVTVHCVNSSSKTHFGNDWATVEIEVKGSELITHKFAGETVLEYTSPQLDSKEYPELSAFYGGQMMGKGYIAIQAETHPTQFKSIELKIIEP